MRRLLVCLLAVSLFLTVFALPSEAGYTAADVGHKFKRGVINTAFGWTEFFASYKVEDNIAMGFWRSLGSPVQRTGVGVVELGTFPFPPYETMMKPESPFDHFP